MASWLFVKGQESVWVERPHGCKLVVAGPRHSREEHDFADDNALDAFQIALAEQLTSGGWFLWASDRDRRRSHERRQSNRPEPNRRQERASVPSH